MMKVASTDDPILKRFKAALLQIYGDQIERIVLYGSRARRSAARFQTHDLRVDFIDDTGAFFDAKAFSIAAYGDHTPLMHEIRRDGLDL